MSITSGNRCGGIKYVYELPYTERKCLCNILDINDQWERLGGEEMGFSVLELSEIKRAEKSGDSPTDRLLQVWGRKNNTILNLYLLLFRMEHYQAMSVIEPFVPENYHLENFSKNTKMVQPTSAGTAAAGAARAISSCPKPDPSLLVNLKSKNAIKETRNQEFVVFPRPSTSQSRSILSDRPTEPNLDSPNKSIKEESSLINFNTAIQKSFVPEAQEAVDQLSSQNRNRNEDGSEKILNTAVPERTLKASAALSSNENNIEECREPPLALGNSNNHKKEIKGASNYPNDIMYVTDNASASNGHPIFNLPSPLEHHATSRIRYKSNGSEFSNMSECCVPMIPYKELEVATHGWNKQLLLGSGGFGSVFKGTWINVKVAVKRINPIVQQDGSNVRSDSLHITQTLDELRFLQKYRHDNILQVYGFSADEGKPLCLVYQFMPNGSLEYQLQCRKIEAFGERDPTPLSWRTRFIIAKGTAAALEYLHVKDKPLIHGDVKSANILLDRNLEPKLGDFGLAREGPQSEYTSMKVSHVHGTRPYIPEEYLRSKKLSIKVDTYSFGIVLFEICSGRRAYNDKSRKYLKDEVLEANYSSSLSSLIDVKAKYENRNVFDILISIGMNCISNVPKKRPDMTAVFQELEIFEKCLKNPKNSQEDLVHGSTSFSMSPSPFPSAAASPYLHPSRVPASYMPHPFSPLPGSHHHPLTSLPGYQPHPNPQPHVSPLVHGWMNGLPINTPNVNKQINEEQSMLSFSSESRQPPIPDFTRIMLQSSNNDQDVNVSQGNLSTENSESSTESSLDMSQSCDIEPKPYVRARAESKVNTVTEVCLPLLAELGINPNSNELKDQTTENVKSVSAQGKKSFLD